MGGGFKTPAKQTKTPAKPNTPPQTAPPQAAKKEDYRAALENSMATRLQKVIKGHKIRKQINDEADVLEQKLLKTEHNIQASKMIANVKQGSELRKEKIKLQNQQSESRTRKPLPKEQFDDNKKKLEQLKEVLIPLPRPGRGGRTKTPSEAATKIASAYKEKLRKRNTKKDLSMLSPNLMSL